MISEHMKELEIVVEYRPTVKGSPLRGGPTLRVDCTFNSDLTMDKLHRELLKLMAKVKREFKRTGYIK